MLNVLLSPFDRRAFRTIALVVAAAFTGQVAAQNLVPNGSFEDTVNCSVPTQCTLLKAAGWYNPTLSTPDVWDADTARLCGYDILTQGIGSMLPADGSRMAGFYFWDGPFGGDSREYIQAELQDVLVGGTTYQISLSYVRNPAFGSVVDHIGVWLGNDSVHEETTGPMSLVPQVKLRDPDDPWLANGNEWSQLVDTFTAVGGERWVILGNFDPQDSIQGMVVDPEAPYANCYYYMDNVMVRALSGTGVVSHAMPSIWWDGSLAVISSQELYGPVTMDVFDVGGRMLYRSTLFFAEGRATAPMEQLVPGIYMVRLFNAHASVAIRTVKGDGSR